MPGSEILGFAARISYEFMFICVIWQRFVTLPIVNLACPLYVKGFRGCRRSCGPVGLWEALQTPLWAWRPGGDTADAPVGL
jgi:hypothetical protein